MQTKEVKLSFKARILKDAEGKEIGKSKKQAPVVVSLQYAEPQDVKELLEQPSTPVKDEKTGEVTGYKLAKGAQMVVDAVNQMIKDQARSQFDEIIEGFGSDPEKIVTADMLDHDKLTLEFISSLEPASRGARAIPDEDWTAMYEDYLQVMVAATGKPETKIKNHLDIFKKPTRVKGNKEILAVLVQQLDVYSTATSNLEDTAECTARLRNKFDKWLNEEDKLDVDAL